jgi:hypothetical protein
MDFLSDIRREILAAMPYDRRDTHVVAELGRIPTTELVAWFCNWLGRLIHAHPREVHLSQSIIFRHLTAQQQVDLEVLGDKIRAGADLTPHLSTRIAHGYRPVRGKKNLRKRLDIDLLLNEWGIHHLHFSRIIESDGFAKRDGPLLFAVFRAHDAFLLDVGDHSQFEDQHFVEVAVRNWPSANIFIPLKGVTIAGGTTPEDRKVLRKAGINTMIQVDGQAFMPATGGLSTAGTSNWLVPTQILRRINQIQRALEKNPHILDEQIRQCGKAPSESPRFRAILCDYPLRRDFGILEEDTGAVIGLL